MSWVGDVRISLAIRRFTAVAPMVSLVVSLLRKIAEVSTRPLS